MFEVHALRRLGDAVWFVGFEGVRFCGFYGAEAAGAGAFVASDHESGGSLAPAFPAVGALRFFADGDEFEIGDEGFGGPEGWVVGEADFDPIGFSLAMESWIHFHFRAAGGHVGEGRGVGEGFNFEF